MNLRYSLHGVQFSIDADDPVADEIARVVMPACVKASRGRQDGSIFVVRREGRRFSVRAGRRLLWHAKNKAELLPWLESEIVNWLLGKCRRYVHVHAAVVERRGRAVVIAGGPDAGKTSLACALGLAGWGVMSDEVALVEPRGLTVACFPRAMLVKAGTARRLPELRRTEPRRVLLDEGMTSIRYVNPESLSGTAREKAKICAIAFPEWSKKSAIAPVGERDAMERLLRASFNTGKCGKTAINACVGLVRGATLFRVQTAGLREAPRLISEAMGMKP